MSREMYLLGKELMIPCSLDSEDLERLYKAAMAVKFPEFARAKLDYDSEDPVQDLAAHLNEYPELKDGLVRLVRHRIESRPQVFAGKILDMFYMGYSGAVLHKEPDFILEGPLFAHRFAQEFTERVYESVDNTVNI